MFNVLDRGRMMVPQTECKRILLLIESDDYRKVIQLGLALASEWELVSSASVHEGLAMAEKKEFDAILLNGDFLAKTLPALLAHPATKNLPIIALMAGGSAKWKVFMPMGVTAVVSKTINPLKLASRIASALNWPIPQPNGENSATS